MKKYYILAFSILIFISGAIVSAQNTPHISKTKKRPYLTNTKKVNLPKDFLATPIWLKSGDSFIAIKDNRFFEIDYPNLNIDFLIELPNKIIAIDISENGDQILIKSFNEKTKKVEFGIINYPIDNRGYSTSSKTNLLFKNKFIKSVFGPTEIDVLANKKIYNQSTDDGHTIINSDLYFVDTRNDIEFQLTETSNILELYPYFHPNGEEIFFWKESLLDSNINGLYVANLNFK